MFLGFSNHFKLVPGMDNIGAVPVNLWGAVILVIEIQDHIQCIFIAGYLQKFLLMVVLSIELRTLRIPESWYIMIFEDDSKQKWHVSICIPNNFKSGHHSNISRMGWYSSTKSQVGRYEWPKKMACCHFNSWVDYHTFPIKMTCWWYNMV